jgi:hypothetical protein
MLKLARHAVELLAELGDLIVPFDRNAGGEIAAADPLRASRKRLIWPWSALEARNENENESRGKATMTAAATIRLVVTEVAVAARSESTVTVTRPAKPGNDCVTASYVTCPSRIVPRARKSTPRLAGTSLPQSVPPARR